MIKEKKKGIWGIEKREEEGKQEKWKIKMKFELLLCDNNKIEFACCHVTEDKHKFNNNMD